MKTIIASLLVLSASTVWAHGNLAHQAQEAVNLALETLQKDEPREILRSFKSVSAELIGHETFAVTVGFTNQTAINYVCAEDESVEPAIWACTKK